MTDEPYWKLAITEEQFTEIYGESVDIQIFKEPAQTEEAMIQDYLPSKLWRMNNLYTIVDKEGTRGIFRMNLSQHRVYAASLHHPRIVILKSRQQGISTFWLISFFDDAMFIPNFTIGLMAQGLDESSTLLTRVKLAWEEFPPEIREFLGIVMTRDNTAELAFMNGSTIFIRTSFRSTTLQRLHISEYGKICSRDPKRAKETKTGTLQAIMAGNTVVIESTAEGDNDFKRTWDTAVEAEAKAIRLGTGLFAGKDFKPIFLSWLDDPDCSSDHYEEPSLKQTEYFDSLEAELGRVVAVSQRNFWIAQYRELADDIYQEYPATPSEAFAKLHDGAYYAKLFNIHVVQAGRIRSNLYDANLEVNVAMDIGMDDCTFMIFYQVFGGEIRIIAEYENSGEALAHYVSKINQTEYKVNWVIGPHDLKVRELGTGISRQDTLRKLGVTRLRVLPSSSVQEGIEAVRQLIKGLYIDESCRETIKCIKNYSKEWDERKEVWKSKPLHDQFSHGADALRYLAMGNISMIPRKNPNRRDRPTGHTNNFAI
jgi:hypothetical protein